MKSIRAIPAGLLLIVLAACQVATPTTPPLPQATPASPQATPDVAQLAPSDTASPIPTAPATDIPVAAATTPPVSELPDTGQVTWEPVVSGLNTPVFVTHAGDGSGRLFIIEKPGWLRIFQDGALQAEAFLDITDRVGSRGNEQGLLGLAFHPNYAENGYIYVNYTDLNGDTVVARFTRSSGDPNRADPASESRLLFISQPFPNHNGGMLAFGPDGYLYIGTGDGGSAGDPQGNGQSLDSLLGKILRINVDSTEPYTTPADNSFSAQAQPEIWAYGLRNPWRFSFDRLTGDLYIGDVGQNQWEEINHLPAGSPAGANFGWSYFEASHPYQDPGLGSDFQQVSPVAEYDHSQGCSVTGGYVYRGSRLPDWQGVYLFGDYCSGIVWGLLRDASGNWQKKNLFENTGNISSFGEDEAGELYLVDINGTVYRLESTLVAESSLIEQQAALLPSAPFDVQTMAGAPQYNLDLAVDYANHTIQGRSQVLVTNTEQDPLDSLYFRLLPNAENTYGNGSLQVSNVTVDGQPVESELSVSDTALKVTLPQLLQPGQSAQVEMDFTGLVPLDFGAPQNPSGYGIYNLTDGVLALASWYPILSVYDEDGWNLDTASPIGDSVYSDMAWYTVNLTAPQELVVASTGTVVAKEQAGDQTTYRIASGPARDFFLVMSPDFQVATRTVDGTQVSSYYLPDSPQAGKAALEITADSLQSYNQRFGQYPYNELDVVQAPMQNAGGVEYPGIFLVADDLYENPDQPNFQIATAHETAHQWWYNLVGNDVFEDPWLDEGLTTYSSSLYYEDQKSPEWLTGLVGYWEDRVAGLKEDGQDDRVTESLAHFENLNDPSVYGGVVYSKGGLFFYALRQEIGDQAFFQALQNYFQKYQYRIARPADLLAEFEAAAGRELDEFYQEWLYSPST